MMMRIKLFMVSVMTALTLAAAAPAFAIGSLGVAVEGTDAGGGNWVGMPGIQGSLEIPFLSFPISARAAYFTMSGTSGGASYQFNNLVYSLTYDIKMPIITLYLGAGNDALSGSVTGTWSGVPLTGTFSNSSAHFRVGFDLSILPMITINGDYRSVSGLYGANTTNAIYALGLIFKI